MKNNLLVFIAALFFIQCTNSTIRSTPEEEPIVVDGLAYDWEKYPVEYNEEWHLVYGAANSDSTLYLVFSFNNPQLARMMARRGVTLWFGEDKKFGLQYKDLSMNGERRFPNPNELYIPKGSFNATSDDSIVAPDLSRYPHIHAQFGLDKGLYCFEFSIPLVTTEDLAFLKNIFAEKRRFGFQLAGLSDEQKERIREDRAEKRSDNGGLSGGMFGGKGGGPGGRMGGRPGGGPGPDKFMNFEGKEIWFNVIIDK